MTTEKKIKAIYMFYKLVFDRGKGSLEYFYSKLSGCGSWFQSHDVQWGNKEEQ